MSAEGVVNWAMGSGIDISILIIIVLLSRRLCAKWFGAQAAYALWALPVLRLILPPFQIVLPRPASLHTPEPTLITPLISSPLNITATIPTEASTTHIFLILMAVWISGAIVWGGLQIYKQSTFMKPILADRRSASKSVQARYARAGKLLKLKKLPALRKVSGNVGPMVSGVWHPVIILPKNFETDFTVHQQLYALMHELAHIKRKDMWMALGSLIFRAINWPNPIVHLAHHKFRTDQEAACDAFVLNILGSTPKARASYAQTLVHAATLSRTLTGQTAAHNPLSLTIYHPLKERLMTMKTSRTKTTLLSRLAVGGFLAVGLLATSPITFAQDDTPAAKKHTKTKSVMKWVENHDGIKSTKHIEVETVDGVTKAYSINENGNRTEISTDEVKTMQLAGGAGKGMKMFMLRAGKDAKPGETMVVNIDVPNALPDDSDLANLMAGDKSVIMIRKTSDAELAGSDALSSEDNIFVMNNGSSASAMVEAAESLLEQVGKDDTDNIINAQARKKLEKARKALAEAKVALEDAEQ